MFSLLIPAFPEFGFCFLTNDVREVVVDFVMAWDGNHESIELEYLMTPSLPDTLKRNILAFRRLLHQFDDPSPTRHYIVNSFLDNSVKCGIYF